MKKIVLIITVLLFANISFGQAWLKNLPKTKSSKELTLYDYQKAFNTYWKANDVKNGKYLKNGELVKAPGWKIFKRWEYYWESRVNNTTGKFPDVTTGETMQKFKSSNSNLKSTGSWVNLGTNSSSGGYAGIGRINCIGFHPSNANTFWVGAPSGGIWKTTNGASQGQYNIRSFFHLSLVFFSIFVFVGSYNTKFLPEIFVILIFTVSFRENLFLIPISINSVLLIILVLIFFVLHELKPKAKSIRYKSIFFMFKNFSFQSNLS